MTTFSEIEERLSRFADPSLGSGATEAEIQAAEAALGVSIQGGYRQFLRRYGWGGVEHVELFGLGQGAPFHLELVALTESERTEMEPALPRHFLPVMNTGGGDLHCLDTRVEGEPPIVYWSHEDGPDQQPDVEAESFNEWLSELLGYLEE